MLIKVQFNGFVINCLIDIKKRGYLSLTVYNYLKVNNY